MRVRGIVTIHVDDAFLTGDKVFIDTVVKGLRKDFKVGSEDLNDIMFVGQRTQWLNRDIPNEHIHCYSSKLRNYVSHCRISHVLYHFVECIASEIKSRRWGKFIYCSQGHQSQYRINCGIGDARGFLDSTGRC